MSLHRAVLLGLALLTLVQVAHTKAEPIPTLAYVAAKNANPKRLDIFKKGLAELGYVEGKNIRVEYREAVLDADYNGVVAELVERKVDIILAANVAATRGERLRILKHLVPQLDKVAMALNGQNPNNAAQLQLLRSEAQKLGIAIEQLDIREPEDVDAAFDKALAFGAQGLVNAVDTFINSRRFALAAGATKHKLPFIFSDIEYVMAGGLMALGPGHYEGYYGAAKYVDKILHGASPADLPIAGPTEFTMSANRTALKNLGLSLPSDLAARVNEWID
jgi:putative ABC transport system substrate-binding protein